MASTTHAGHRNRVRERFRTEGLEGFAPHEVLELLLFYGRARGDTNGLAHDLLDAFGSLKGVLEATPEQLMAVNGVGEETATLIGMMVPMFRRYQECAAAEKTYIRTREEAVDFCKSLLAGYRNERFYVACLSGKNALLGRRMIAEGTMSEVGAYPRKVVETALNYNAAGVILFHNHPGGTEKPSREDVQVIRQIQSVLKGLGIVLLDHIVVAGERAYSMAENGEISGR